MATFEEQNKERQARVLEVLEDLRETILVKSKTTYFARIGDKVVVAVLKYSIQYNYRLYYQGGFRRYPDLGLYIPELSTHNNPHHDKKNFVKYETDTLDKLINSYTRETLDHSGFDSTIDIIGALETTKLNLLKD